MPDTLADTKQQLEHELGLLYNYTDDDSKQFTRHDMVVAIRHGMQLTRDHQRTQRAKVPMEFIDQILHGDAVHRQWLSDAAVKYNDGKPIPESSSGPTRGFHWMDITLSLILLAWICLGAVIFRGTQYYGF